MKWLEYKQAMLRVGFLSFILLCMMTMNVLEIEFAGFLYVLSFSAVLLYLLAFWILKLLLKITWSNASKRKEVLCFFIITIILSVVTIFDAYEDHFPVSLLFAEILLFSLLGLYWYYFNTPNKDNRHQLLGISGKSIIAITIAILITSIIIVIDDIEVFQDFFGLLQVALFLILFTLAIRWLIGQIRSIMTLKNEQTKAELKHLQNQVNPHFFFNILNNLYGVIDQDSEKAKKLILKLSDMMRYSIYDGQKEWATLEEEVAYLNNYIALQQMRYHKKIDVQFDMSGDLTGIKILPLLFIILLENAFKHGAEKLRDNAYIHIQLTADSNQIVFQIRNNFDTSEVQEQPGIGLANLRRRLELVYPNKHELSHHTTNDIYEVALSLNLL